MISKVRVSSNKANELLYESVRVRNETERNSPLNGDNPSIDSVQQSIAKSRETTKVAQQRLEQAQ